MASDSTVTEGGSSGLHRSFLIIRALADAAEPLRLTEIAEHTGLAQATAHRILRMLMAEKMVEQPTGSKLYRLSLDFFGLAVSVDSSHPTLRSLCRPILLRLSGMLNDTIFLLARTGFDAMCLDRSAGPFPIRTYTGDVGGRVALGVGQSGMVILAMLPEDERDEIIRFNVPRMQHLEYFDEIYLRSAIEQTRKVGYATNSWVAPLSGMGGVAVPIMDRNGYPVAALSIGTLAERVNEKRLPAIVEVLRKEADKIGKQLHPFDTKLW